ncbi:S-layer homology domain-containing protein [Anoxynatronum sibiricum]|uniref:S-layer homology domain-containing protein n=1 Tax=Anoxynatronum sibiricum TaxID=210623 RepID=A0ABU9VYT2_9CLOT
MKKGQKSCWVVILVGLLFLNATISAAAVSFPDINASHWAWTHVSRMVEKNVISGTTRANSDVRIYAPDDPVTKVQTLTLVYKLLQETGQMQSNADFSTKYQQSLNAASIPQWAHRFVSYALEKNIITMADLVTFMEGSGTTAKENPASREEVALYFGRALDTQGKAGTGSSNLSFVDAEQISSSAMPYVAFLVNEKILSGYEDNRFRPRNTITRAEMAAVSNKSYDVLSNKSAIIIDLKPVEPEKEEEKEEDKTDVSVDRRITRTIEEVNQDTRRLFVLDDNDRLEMYDILRDAEILIKSKSSRLADLRKSQTAVLHLNKDNEIIKLIVDPEQTRFDGELISKTELDDYIVYRMENLRNLTERVNFRVNKDTEIISGSSTLRERDIKVGDRMTLFHDGLYVLKLQPYQQYDEIEGILDSVQFARYQITVRGSGNQTDTYSLADDVSIFLNDRRSDLDQLRSGDIVKLKLEKDEVVRIDATQSRASRNQVEKGFFKELRIATRPNRIFIIDKDDKEVSFDLSDRVAVYIRDEKASLLDIPMNAEVELFIEGGLVTEIDVVRNIGREVIQGEIQRIYDNSNRFTLSVSGRSETVMVYVTNSTDIYDRNYRKIDIDGLRRNDYVLVTGTYEDNDFVASRILVED